MNNKIVQTNIFNTILNEFLDFLYYEKTFDMFTSDINLIKSGIEIIRFGNERMIVEELMSYTKLYKDQILNCDEDFFINYEKNLVEVTDDLLFKKVRDIWVSKNITDILKAKIWWYIQRLYKVGEKIIN